MFEGFFDGHSLFGIVHTAIVVVDRIGHGFTIISIVDNTVHEVIITTYKIIVTVQVIIVITIDHNVSVVVHLVQFRLQRRF